MLADTALCITEHYSTYKKTLSKQVNAGEKDPQTKFIVYNLDNRKEISCVRPKNLYGIL